MKKENESSLKAKVEQKLQKIFDKMGRKDPKRAIHGTAAAAALVVAGLPIGVDAWALRLCEIYMLMSIYAYYGQKITRSAAESMMSAAFMQKVGEEAAKFSLQAADVAAAATGGLASLGAFGIKMGVATTLIEAVGWTTVKYLEGNKVAKAAIRAVEGFGVVSDVGRVVNVIKGGATAVSGSGVLRAGEGAQAGTVSFCGSDSKLKGLESKIRSADNKVKQYGQFVESDIKFNRDPSRNRINLEYAVNQANSLRKEYNRLSKKL